MVHMHASASAIEEAWAQAWYHSSNVSVIDVQMPFLQFEYSL